MNEIIEQIKAIKGVVEIYPTGGNSIVVVFEPQNLNNGKLAANN